MTPRAMMAALGLAMNMLRRSTLALLVPALLLACRGDDGTGASDTASSSSSSSSSGTDSASSTSAAATETGTSTTTGASTTDASAGFITTQGATDTGVMPQPNGAQCTADAECVSMHCYQIPMLGGVCSECNTDKDCVDAGTGIACSLEIATMQAQCTAGGLGDTCMSQASCGDGLFCAEVVEGTFGLIPSACSNCLDSGDCTNGQLCAPNFDQMALEGYKECVDPGSIANDQLCSLKDMGDASCMSGHCGEVAIMGFITVGVCGECDSDADCMMGTCIAGSFDQNTGLKGSVCG